MVVMEMADVFEQKMEEFSKMPEDEVTRLLEEEKKLCICKDCSTYDTCMTENMEGLYCALGKSPCLVHERECICSGCPIYKEYGLTYNNYCIKGSENELRKRQHELDIITGGE